MKLLTLLYTVLFSLNVLGQNTDCSIFFKSGSFEPGYDELQRLKECADAFLKSNYASMKVTGYADTTSNWAFNWSLSQNRAKKIKNWLIVMGVPEEKILTDHKGESTSLSDKEKDRRVDILFRSDTLTLQQLFAEQDADIQYFSFDPLKENEIKCEKGTVLIIPKDCFVDANGDIIKSPINLQVQEYYNLGDYVKKGMYTTSQRIDKTKPEQFRNSPAELLQSGGVINVNATYKGEKIYFNQGMKMGIGFNAPADNNMMAFMGVANESEVNWFEDLVSKQPGRGIKGTEIWVKDSVVMYESEEHGKKIIIDTAAIKEKDFKTYRFIDRRVPSVYVNSLGFINCDKFWGDPTAVEMQMTFDLSAFENDSETSVYMIFQKTMSVLPVYRMKNSKGETYFQTTKMKMPVGTKAHAIAVNKSGEKFYLGAEEFDLKGDKSIKIEFYKATLKDITQFLAQYKMN